MPNPYTIVDAINQVVETTTKFPWGLPMAPSAIITGTAVVTAATTTTIANPDTTSIYARAEQFLDRARYQVLAMGWPENTEMSRPFVASGNKVSLASANVLNIKGSGPDSHRNLVIRTDGTIVSVYDANLRTFSVTTSATGTIYLDCVLLLTWADLPTKLADLVIQRAKVMFNRRLGENEQLNDAQLGQEYDISNEVIDRNSMSRQNVPFNTKEEATSTRPPQARQQG